MGKTFRKVILDHIDGEYLKHDVLTVDLAAFIPTENTPGFQCVMKNNVKKIRSRDLKSEVLISSMTREMLYDYIIDYEDDGYDDFMSPEIETCANLIARYGNCMFRSSNMITELTENQPLNDSDINKIIMKLINIFNHDDAGNYGSIFIYADPEYDYVISRVEKTLTKQQFGLFGYHPILKIHGAMANVLGISGFMFTLKSIGRDEFLAFSASLMSSISKIDSNLTSPLILNPMYPFIEMVKRYGEYFIDHDNSDVIDSETFANLLNNFHPTKIAKIKNVDLEVWYGILEKWGIDPRNSKVWKEKHNNISLCKNLVFIPNPKRVIAEIIKDFTHFEWALYCDIDVAAKRVPDLGTKEIIGFLNQLDQWLCDHMIVYQYHPTNDENLDTEDDDELYYDDEL